MSSARIQLSKSWPQGAQAVCALTSFVPPAAGAFIYILVPPSRCDINFLAFAQNLELLGPADQGLLIIYARGKSVVTVIIIITS